MSGRIDADPRTRPGEAPAVTPGPRLAVKPALRRLWRDESTLQLGLDPAHAVVLTGLASADRVLLDLLDGGRDRGEVLAAASAAGVPRGDAEHLLDVLDRAHLLEHRGGSAPSPRPCPQPDLLSLTLRYPEPGAVDRVLARRHDTAVTVAGTGRVATTVRALLATAGVSVRADDDGARPGTTATAADGRPALTVVETTTGTIDPVLATTVRDRPHLLAGVRETTGIVGPLVLPGRTPCLRCVELVRAERDPQWPALAAHLASRRRPPEPCDTALATAAGSLAALHVLTWVDSGGAALPPSAAGVVELDVGGTRLRRRTVAAHPDCGCGAG